MNTPREEIQLALKFRADTTNLAKELLETKTCREEAAVRRKLIATVFAYYNIEVPIFK